MTDNSIDPASLPPVASEPSANNQTVLLNQNSVLFTKCHEAIMGFFREPTQATEPLLQLAKLLPDLNAANTVILGESTLPKLGEKPYSIHYMPVWLVQRLYSTPGMSKAGASELGMSMINGPRIQTNPVNAALPKTYYETYKKWAETDDGVETDHMPPIDYGVFLDENGRLDPDSREEIEVVNSNFFALLVKSFGVINCSQWQDLPLDDWGGAGGKYSTRCFPEWWNFPISNGSTINQDPRSYLDSSEIEHLSGNENTTNPSRFAIPIDYHNHHYKYAENMRTTFLHENGSSHSPPGR